MALQKLTDFLDAQDVKYVRIGHSSAYTAQEIAESAHVPGKELAKTVMILVENTMAMAVLPATHHMDVFLLRDNIGAEEVSLAREEEFQNLFPDCELGAMPPFGNLYGVPVYVCNSLAEEEHIAFNAGSHRELVQLKYSDFARLVSPIVANFSTKT